MKKDACKGPWTKAVIVDVWFKPEKARTSKAVRAWLTAHKMPAPSKIFSSVASHNTVAKVRDSKKYKCFRFGAWNAGGVRFLFGGNPKKGKK